MDAATPIRVLVVDDEAAHVRALCDTLGARGYATQGSASAEAALELIGREPFELLLADLIMPGTGGIELVKAARARPGPGLHHHDRGGQHRLGSRGHAGRRTRLYSQAVQAVGNPAGDGARPRNAAIAHRQRRTPSGKCANMPPRWRP
ncbi:response regulator [Massilia sp. B-10]|nr:response regulator [Massilia sp. B-10]